MDMTLSLLDGIEIVLCAALLLLVLLNVLNLPSILGYLILGVAVGPFGVGLIKETHIANEFAEIGVVLLLFTIGLEFSVTKLISLKRFVFFYGFLQVSLSLLITTLVAKGLAIPLSQAVVIGAVAAMSSTAIVSKLLKEQDELGLPHGQRTMGILLFQDLAVIPLMILIPSLGMSAFNGVLSQLAWAIAKGGVAIAAILFLGQLVLKPMFAGVAKTKSMELFTLTILVVTLTAAWLTNHFGLSFALGAFLAGMMLGETEFRHQIAIDIRPFRDIFLGLFFLSIGFLIDLKSLFLFWPWILLFLTALIALKFIIIFLLCWHGKQDKLPVAIQTGLALAQGGEFGLVLLNLALAKDLLPRDYGQVLLISIFLSMLIAPILMRNSARIVYALFNKKSKHMADVPNLSAAKQMSNHVIILGFGRVGQNIAKIISTQQVPFIALDLEIERVKLAFKAGENVFYGDATQKEILAACQIKGANSVVISFYHPHHTPLIIEQIRDLSPNIDIIVRCYDDTEVDALYDLGVNEVIPESIEASLMLAFHMLLRAKVPMKSAWKTIETIRRNRYDMFNYLFPDSDSTEDEHDIVMALEVSTETSFKDAGLSEVIKLCSPARLIRVRRGTKKLDLSELNQAVREGDILVMHALPGCIEQLRDKFQLI